jgi:rubredoxin
MSERWLRGVCGYVHTGATPPSQCPSCGAPFTAFQLRPKDPAARYRDVELAEPRPPGFRYVILGNSAAGRSAAR